MILVKMDHRYRICRIFFHLYSPGGASVVWLDGGMRTTDYLCSIDPCLPFLFERSAVNHLGTACNAYSVRTVYVYYR